MNIIDKHNLISKLRADLFTRLELGCGNRKKNPDSIGIDLLDYECVDLVGDIYEVLAEIPNEVIDEVYSSHFFEHVPDVSLLLTELARVMKKNGKVTIIVPHFSNPYFYSDVTHKSFFGLYSMSYFVVDMLLSRRVPTYQRVLNFSLVSTYFEFKSSPPFYIRHGLKKIIGFLVNFNYYTKELYEEMFCFICPCYEIRYELRRN
jgi:hypothetical protein